MATETITKEKLDLIRARIAEKVAEHDKKYLTTAEKVANFKKSIEEPIQVLTLKEFKKGIKKRVPTLDVTRLYDVYDEYKADESIRIQWNRFILYGETQNDDMFEWMDDIVEDTRQMIAFVIGTTNFGKSTFGQQLIFELNVRRKRATKYYIDIKNLLDFFKQGEGDEYGCYLTYSLSQCLRSITKVSQEWGTSIMDEYIPPWGVNSVKLKARLSVVVQAVTRAMHKNVVVCTPEEHRFPQVSIYFEVIGKNKKTHQTLALMQIPRRKGKQTKARGIVFLQITQSDEQMAWYSFHSKEEKHKIELAEGAMGSGGIGEEELEELSKKFLDKLHSIKAGKYKDWILKKNKAGGWKNIHMLYRRIDEISMLDEESIKSIIDYAFTAHKGSKNEDPDDDPDEEDQVLATNPDLITDLPGDHALKPLDALISKRVEELEPKTHCCQCTPGNHQEKHLVHVQFPICTCDPNKYVLARNEMKFTFDLDKILAEYGNQEFVKMYRLHKVDRISQREISEREEYDCSPQNVCTAIGSVTGHISNRIGGQYVGWFGRKKEKELVGQYESIEYDEENVNGKPDVCIKWNENRYWVYCVKCENPASSVVEKYPVDYSSEVNFCNKLKAKFPNAEIKAIFHYDNYGKNRFAEKEFDFINQPLKIAIKKANTVPFIELY